MMPRRRYATAAGGGAAAPPGQPEVLKMLDKTIGNKWFLHLALPLVVTLNGWAHLHAVIPADTYWLPAAYWSYSFRASLTPPRRCCFRRALAFSTLLLA